MLTIIFTFVITVVVTIFVMQFLKDTPSKQTQGIYISDSEEEEDNEYETGEKNVAAKQYFWENINSERNLDPFNAVEMIKNQLLAMKGKDNEETDQLRVMLIEILLEIEKFEEAEKVIEFMLKKYPHRQDLLMQLALAFRGEGAQGKALEIYKKVLRINEDNIEALKELGNLYVKSNQPAEAIEIYKELLTKLSSKEDLKEVLSKIGLLCEKTEKWQGAVTAYLNILNMFPNDYKTLKGLKTAYFALGNDEEALDVLRKLANSEQLDYEVLEELMTILYKRQEYDEFIETTKHLLKFPDANIDSIQNIIAKVFLKTEKYQESIELLNKILEQCPENWYLKQVLAQAHMELHQYENAIEIYKDLLNIIDVARAKMIKSNISNAYCEYGAALYETRKYVNAFECFQTAMRYDPNNPDVFYQISYCNFLIKNYTEAFTNVQRALDLEPHNAKYNLLLADVFIAQDNYDDALRIYKEILERDAHDKDALQRAAKISEKQLQFEDAISYFSRYLELDDSNVEVLCDTAKCYKAVNRKEEDIEKIYQRVLELDAQNEVAAEYFNQKEALEQL